MEEKGSEKNMLLCNCMYRKSPILNIELGLTCRLFQEERPVWHNIDCNPLPKDYTEPKVEEDNFQTEKITMVTDIKYSPDILGEEYAT